MKNYHFLLILLPISLFSSNGDGPIGARSAALGNANKKRNFWFVLLHYGLSIVPRITSISKLWNET